MYQLFIDTETAFAPEMVGEFQELEEAQKAAKEELSKDSTATYEIKETNGGFNNYGELIATLVERG